MRFHWGHGIALTFSIFVVFILTMIFKSTQDKIHLVSEDYYGEELRFQEQIDKVQNTRALAEAPNINLEGRKLTVIFPQNLFQQNDPEGQITLFRPSNSQFDQEFKLVLNAEGRQEIILKDILSGFYKVQLEWADGSKAYYTEKSINLQ